MDRFCKECGAHLNPVFNPETKKFDNTCPSHKKHGHFIRRHDSRSVSKTGEVGNLRDLVLSPLYDKTFMYCEKCEEETEASIVCIDVSSQRYIYPCHKCVLKEST